MESNAGYQKWLRLEKEQELRELIEREEKEKEEKEINWVKVVENKHMLELTDMYIGSYNGECILYNVDGLKLVRDGEIIDVIDLIQSLETKINAFIEETRTAQEYAVGGPRYEEGKGEFGEGKLAQESSK